MRADRYLWFVLALLLTAGCGRKSDEVTTPLHQAVAKGDANQVQALLSQGTNVDARDLGGRTPLFVAVGSTSEKVIALLLEHRASVNLPDKWGHTALHEAARRGRTDVARLLVARGAFVKTKGQDGETPLHAAIQSDPRDLTLIELIVAKGADVNAANREGDTPLLWAVQYDPVYDERPNVHTNVVRFLLAKGADANVTNKTGETPLSLAIKRHNLELVRLLVDNGAQPNRGASLVLAMNADYMEIVKFLVTRGADMTLHLAAYIGEVDKAKALIESGADVNARDPAGQSPLHTAAWKDRREMAELLVNSGADVNAQAVRGWTPLHEAAFRGHKDIAELLLARGATVNARTSAGEDRVMTYGPHRAYYPSPGTTPLHEAVKHVDVVRVLLAHGADIHARTEGGGTPVYHAVLHGSRDVVGLLIAAGAEISIHDAALMGFAAKVGELLDGGADANAPDENGHTPLDLAVVGGCVDVVEVLVSHGANPDEEYDNDDGIEDETLLCKAVQLDFPDVARALIAHGADVHAKDRSGNTPLHSAAYYGRVDAAQMLLVHGADPNAKADNGKRPLDYAQEAGFADVVQLLGGDPADLKRGPYKIMVMDPNAIRRLVGRSIESVWVPSEDQLEEFEANLRIYLRENIVVDAREPILSHLRRFHREYSGFISDGKRYITCNLNLGNLGDKPPENRFSGAFDAWWTITHFVYDVKSKTMLRPGSI